MIFLDTIVVRYTLIYAFIYYSKKMFHICINYFIIYVAGLVTKISLTQKNVFMYK